MVDELSDEVLARYERELQQDGWLRRFEVQRLIDALRAERARREVAKAQEHSAVAVVEWLASRSGSLPPQYREILAPWKKLAFNDATEEEGNLRD